MSFLVQSASRSEVHLEVQSGVHLVVLSGAQSRVQSGVYLVDQSGVQSWVQSGIHLAPQCGGTGFCVTCKLDCHETAFGTVLWIRAI